MDVCDGVDVDAGDEDDGGICGDCFDVFKEG